MIVKVCSSGDEPSVACRLRVALERVWRRMLAALLRRWRVRRAHVAQHAAARRTLREYAAQAGAGGKRAVPRAGKLLTYALSPTALPGRTRARAAPHRPRLASSPAAIPAVACSLNLTTCYLRRLCHTQSAASPCYASISAFSRLSGRVISFRRLPLCAPLPTYTFVPHCNHLCRLPLMDNIDDNRPWVFGGLCINRLYRISYMARACLLRHVTVDVDVMTT